MFEWFAAAYMVMTLVAIAAGLVSLRQLGISDKLIVLLLILNVLTEVVTKLADYFKFDFQQHHTVLSIAEVVIPVCIFYALYGRITIVKAILIAVIWGAGVVVMNILLDDSVKQKNYPLLIQSLILALLSCIAFFRLLTRAELRPWRQISFWFWCTLLISSAYSVLHWGVLAIIKTKYPELRTDLNTGYAVVALLLTTIIALAFIVLPSRQAKI